MNPVLLKSESNLERFFFALARPTEYDRWYNDDKFSSYSFLNVLYIYIFFLKVKKVKETNFISNCPEFMPLMG